MRPIALQLSATLLTIVSSFAIFIAPASAQGIHYEVTETESSGRVYGWEHELTDRDPNLSHWHWEPIGAHSHQRNVRRIVDPNATASAKPLEIVRSHYIKPIHVPLPGTGSNGGSSTTADLNGKLLKKSHGSAVIAQSKAISTYSDYAKTGSTHESYSSAVKTQVAGNIVRIGGKRASYNESPKLF